MENSKSYPTTKEVSLISDLLMMESLLYKKLCLASKLTMNEKLKESLIKLSKGHKERFLALYSLL